MQATPQRHRQLASIREISRTYDDSLGGRLMPARPSLAEPVMVARFWANRRGEAIVIQLREFEGRALVDVRKYFFSIVPGVGPHVAQLVCDSCNRGGRWLSQNHFGAPA
jgi:hypothetical protein